jgi:hypothetical protein
VEEEPSLRSGRNWAGKSQVKRYKFPITRENERMEGKKREWVKDREGRENGGQKKKGRRVVIRKDEIRMEV